jgi:hypothetical protein
VVTTVVGIRCWGYGYYGQLGSGTTADGLTPVSVIGLSRSGPTAGIEKEALIVAPFGQFATA